MARKRRKRSIKWKPILLLLLIGNIAAGLIFSPITASRTIRVVGALEQDQPFIESTVQALRDRPYLRAPQRAVESRLLALDRIRRADLTTNLFGRGVLQIRYREAVAVLQNAPNVKLSPGGELFQDDRQVVGVPMVQVPASAQQPIAALAYPVELKALAEVSGRAQRIGLGDNLVVSVDEGGRLCLNKEGYGQIVLGSSKSLDEKFEKLQAYLEEDPEALTKIRELNLTSPDNPTITPK